MARPKSGTKEGKIASKKWKQTMLKKYGEDGLRKKMQGIGAKGGRNSGTGGFASDVVGKDGLTGRERAAIIAKKSGRMGKRGYKLIKKTLFHYIYQKKDTGEIVKFPAIRLWN